MPGPHTMHVSDSLLASTASFIEKEHLFTKKDRLVLAVSGGMDSAVLADILHKLGYGFEIAHMNFQLRGAESERDELFVQDLARHYRSRIHVKRVDAKAHANQHKQSIQESARDLRYQWFDELCSESSTVKTGEAIHGPGGEVGKPVQKGILLTAHHLDDNIETTLMQFFQGTGLAGLRGMLPATNRVVRPLLFASRQEIEAYAETHALCWVEDSSNLETKYTRNFLRKELIPLIEQIFPSFRCTMSLQLHRYRDMESFMQHQLSLTHRKLFVQKGEEWHLPVFKLLQTPGAETILFHLIAPFGFHAAQLPDVMHLLQAETGRQVSSATHRIIRNRAWLILAPLAAEKPDLLIIQALPEQLSLGDERYAFESTEALPSQDALTDPSIQYLDSKDIKFPLIVRRWRKGDYFYPLGMRKKKKLARFFIDERLSATDKEKQWILESGGKILAVLGKRIDDRFKITPSTKNLIRIHHSLAAKK
jgi:tRNA(Ile)-lysidine synthase